ncbi:MAG TPA: hypothetical protein VGN88_06200 [Phycisphaerae bacterium]|jgi:hypothetical protein
MRKFTTWLTSFNGVVWAFVIVVSLFLGIFPLARNLWAYWTWEQVACWQAPDSKRFFFQVDGTKYLSECDDFWYATNVRATKTLDLRVFQPNSTCYIKRGDAVQAVHFLDAHKRLDKALPRVGIIATLVFIAILLTWATRKRSGTDKILTAGEK